MTKADGFAVVTTDGAFVGIWRARDLAEKILNRSPAVKGERIEPMCFSASAAERDLLDRAYKMMLMSGYRVTEQKPDHNNPIIAWMADARVLLYGDGPQPDIEGDLHRG